MVKSTTSVTFPLPRRLEVNMMPFIPNKGLPDYLSQYELLVAACCPPDPDQVNYLTVDEHPIQSSGTHRRGGIHTEAFLGGRWGGSWGGRGGVWMASTVTDSCRVWNIEVAKINLGVGGCGAHLDLSQVGNRTLDANELVNFSDCTPHESLPLIAGTSRQFFRLVGPDISHWFSAHSTSNPSCPLPEFVSVIHGNKFHNPNPGEKRHAQRCT